MFNFLLNKDKYLRRVRIKATLAFIAFVLLSALSCGKRTPPLPPVERVSQSTTISGFQQGDKIILSWKMPVRNSSQNDANFIDQINIYRLAETINSPVQITEEEFSSRSTLIDSISISNDNFALKTLSYTDNLEFSSQIVRLRYAIKFVNSSGQQAAFSNFITLNPSAKIAREPENLDGLITQEAIVLSWEKPQTNVDGSTPANVLGFNVYRQEEKQSDIKKLNDSPIPDTKFSDQFFDFNKNYTYFVRTISIGFEGVPIESTDSAEFKVAPNDTFPPNAPESISIAASPNSISLFFAANPEKDILGYKVYRSTDVNISLTSWELLTAEPITTNTFEDRNIRSGVTYNYYLTAIDKFNNTSQPSKIVSETAP